MKDNVKVILFLFLLGLTAFANSLGNPLLIDDHAFFEQRSHFSAGIFQQKDGKYYRPLAELIPFAWYELFHNNVTAYHTANLVLFCLAGFGVYLFLRRLGASYLVALLASAFYIIHPVNGFAVNYITASVYPAEVIFILFSLYLILNRHSERSEESLKGLIWLRSFASLRMTLACFFYLLSSCCHETAIAVPFYAFLLVFIYSDQKGVGKKCQDAWGKVWPLFVTMFLILIFRTVYSPLQQTILSMIPEFHMNFWQYLATWTMLLVWYLSNLFYPAHVVLIMIHQPLTSGIACWIFVFVVLVGSERIRF